MFHYQILLIVTAMFGGILACFLLGRVAAQYQMRRNGESPGRSFAALEGSVFGLMTLVLAFTFSSSAARFETRRRLVVSEATVIEIAWERVALLPAEYQGATNEKLRQYLDARVLFYARMTDRDAALSQLNRATTLREELWKMGIESTKGSSPAVISLVLSSLNTMTDLSNDSFTLAQTHLPGLIQILLVVLPVICAVLAGFEASQLKARFWLPLLLFALAASLTVMVIFDLDYPRVGLVRLDAHDQVLTNLQVRMQAK